MTLEPTARWALMAELEFLQTTGHVHLPEAVLRRKIDWHAVAIPTMNASSVGNLDYPWSSVPCIAAIWVLESYRHEGAGRALLHFVKTEARAQGQSMLYSSSQLGEPSRQVWHRRMGFEECGILDGHNAGVGKCFSGKDCDNKEYLLDRKFS